MSEASPPQPASAPPAVEGPPAGEAPPAGEGSPPGHAPLGAARRRSPWLRPKRLLLIALGVFLFLAISGELARFFSVENLERDEDLALIQAEARGDVAGMAARLSGCRDHPACVARLRRIDANPRVRRPGSVKILDLESKTAYSLTGSSGPSRVAWTVIGTLPVIQCVQIRRTGNFLTGIKLQLLSITPPIQNEADC